MRTEFAIASLPEWTSCRATGRVRANLDLGESRNLHLVLRSPGTILISRSVPGEAAVKSAIEPGRSPRK